MKTKHAPTINDYVYECRACGYAGFSHGTANRKRLRAEVPHTVEIVNGRPARRYKVSDLLEFKRINKICNI